MSGRKTDAIADRESSLRKACDDFFRKLSSIKFLDGELEWHEIFVESGKLRASLRKEAKDCLSEMDVFVLACGYLQGFFAKQSLIRNSSGSFELNGESVVDGLELGAIFSAKDFDKLEVGFVDMLLSYPKRFEFLFPLPLLPDLDADKSFELDKGMALQFIKAKEKKGLQALQIDAAQSGRYGWYLRVSGAGYFHASADDSAFVNAYDKYRRFVSILRVSGIYGDDVLSDQRGADRPVYCLNEECAGNLHNQPMEISYFLKNHEVPGSKDKRANDYLSELIGRIRDLSVLIDAPATGVGHILAALEWLFEAESERNKTFSFIKICIALEALYGAGIEESITTRLADRYAFSLGGNSLQRQKISDGFKNVYSIRSKLVHGVKGRLSQDEVGAMSYAHRLLLDAIKLEIDSFMNDKKE